MHAQVGEVEEAIAMQRLDRNYKALMLCLNNISSIGSLACYGTVTSLYHTWNVSVSNYSATIYGN